MDILPRDAVKHIPLIILGIWPVNLLTLWAQGHSWGWAQTPPAIMGLWEWGLFVSLSLAILTELGVKMFIALAERRRKLNQARAEGIAEGTKGRKPAGNRRDTGRAQRGGANQPRPSAPSVAGVPGPVSEPRHRAIAAIRPTEPARQVNAGKRSVTSAIMNLRE